MRAALLGLSVLALACPEKRAPIDEGDPLIQKLKAEQERLAKGGAPGGPPGANVLKEPPPALAEVAQLPPDMPVPILVSDASVTQDGVTVTPRRLESAQVISGAKVKLSTTERFVRLVVSVATTKETSFDLSKATLVRGQEVFELARDVQRVGQGSPLAATIAPGVAQDLVLHFEVPPAALAKGLSLRLGEPEPLVVPLVP